MRSKDPEIAVLATDLHLSEKPPLMRTVEKNWYKVQKNYLDQLYSFRKEIWTPIIIGGDVMNSPYCSPEFVNFLIQYFPEVYAIPGNHDLPHNNLMDIRKSVYWTLVKINRIKPIFLDGGPTNVAIDGQYGKLRLFGFTSGQKITPCECPSDGSINLAVIHAYIWMKEHRFKDAPKAMRLKNYLRSLKGYDAALFGDNHKGFLYKGKIDILNCGTFIRRRADEIDYRPRVGILHQSGKITTKYLDTTKDKICKMKVHADNGEELDLEGLIDDLESLKTTTTDIRTAVQECLIKNRVSKKIKNWILGLLDKREQR